MLIIFLLIALGLGALSLLLMGLIVMRVNADETRAMDRHQDRIVTDDAA